MRKKGYSGKKEGRNNIKGDRPSKRAGGFGTPGVLKMWRQDEKREKEGKQEGNVGLVNGCQICAGLIKKEKTVLKV